MPNAHAAEAPFSLELMLTALQVALTAAGGSTIIKRILFGSAAIARAELAGEVAAGHVAEKAAAMAVLEQLDSPGWQVKLGALVLALLLALPASGSEVISVERAQLFPDGGTAAVEVEGGCWLSESRCIRTASELERLRAENESLRHQAEDVSFTVAVVALLVGLGAGFAVARLAN